jgi:hypothetical protein
MGARIITFNKIITLIFIGLALSSVISMGASNSGDSAHRMLELKGEVVESRKLSILMPEAFNKRYHLAVGNLKEASKRASNNTKTLTVTGELVGQESLSPAIANAFTHPDAFSIEVDSAESIVRISALNSGGLLQGINRLTNILAQADNLRAGEIIDWPDHEIRAVHITLRDVSVAMIKRVVDYARAAGFNTIILQLADAVDFKMLVPVREDSLSIKQLKVAVDYARANGLRVIPEIKLLSHQEKFFGEKFKELMFNKVTYDPRNDEVYELVFSYLDRVILELEPSAIHIGHDEIRGFTEEQREKHLSPNERVLPAELFLADVNRLYDYLDSRGIEVWMWGDALLAPSEFPKMHSRQLKGNLDYAQLRSELPKKIFICDWHYRGTVDFLSAQAFAKEGFPVLGATWKIPPSTKAFSKYVAKMEPSGKGMIATTWWTVRRRQWDVVKETIMTSGEVFWYAK